MIIRHKQELLKTKKYICLNNIKEKEKTIKYNDDLYDTNKYKISTDNRNEYHTYQEELRHEKKGYKEELDNINEEDKTYSNEIYNLQKL